MLLILCIFTVFFPEIDIKFSSIFFNGGFLYKNIVIAKFIFHIVPLFTKLFIIAVLVYLFLSPKKRIALFLLTSVAIGPGFLINGVLKSQISRARPEKIIEFGGDKTFTPAFFGKDGNCLSNCSFPSGHVAMATYFSILGYVCKPVFYHMGLIFGIVTGFCRIIQGGHFLSDVLWAMFFILKINKLLYLSFFKLK